MPETSYSRYIRIQSNLGGQTADCTDGRRKPTAVEGVTESQVGGHDFKESVIRTIFGVELALKHSHFRHQINQQFFVIITVIAVVIIITRKPISIFENLARCIPEGGLELSQLSSHVMSRAGCLNGNELEHMSVAQIGIHLSS